MVIGLLFANLLLMFILGTAFIGLILLIISLILFSKNKKEQLQEKNNNKIGATITLVISIIFFLPTLFSVFGIGIYSQIQNNKERKVIESLENKVIVKRDEWKKGFEYNGKKLIPVNIFINNYGYNDNLNKIGALVIKHTNSYYSLYEIDNDSGYKLYYVWVETLAKGEYYTRTFVDEIDYNAVLEYYKTNNFEINVLWKSAPEDTKLSNVTENLKLKFQDNGSELMELSHEVLDDLSNRKRDGISLENYDNHMEFNIISSDRALIINLVVYTKDDKIKLDLNGYEVDDKIVEKHRDMLLYLINGSQNELLKNNR